MRIVSTTCSNTEIVCALGCAGYLVGVDDHSDFPPEVVAGLPRVGPDLSVNMEQIAALQPDLVLASLTVPGHEQVIDGLKQAGLPYFAPEPVSIQDIYKDIKDIGAALGVHETANELITEMKSTLQPIQRNTRPRILIQWWPKPVIAPGQFSWATELLELCGARNPLAELPVKSTPIEDSGVAELDPDAIVIAWCGVKPEKYRPDVVYNNPAFSEMRAITEKRVFCVPEAFLGRPSPRLLDGYTELNRIAGQIV